MSDTHSKPDRRPGCLTQVTGCGVTSARSSARDCSGVGLISMKPTQADLAFWNVKKAPRFAQALLNKNASRFWFNPSATIHACVNSHVELKKSDAEVCAGNLLAILRSMRHRRADLRSELARIAASPGTVVRPEKRAAYARKWLGGMTRGVLPPWSFPPGEHTVEFHWVEKDATWHRGNKATCPICRGA